MEENGFCSCPRELFKPVEGDVTLLGKSDVDPPWPKQVLARLLLLLSADRNQSAVAVLPSNWAHMLFCRCTLIMGAFYPFPALPLENAVWMKVLQLVLSKTPCCEKGFELEFGAKASDVPNVQCAKRPMCQMSVCQMSVCEMSSVRNVQCAKCPMCQMSVCQMSVCQMSSVRNVQCAKCPMCQMSVCQIAKLLRVSKELPSLNFNRPKSNQLTDNSASPPTVTYMTRLFCLFGVLRPFIPVWSRVDWLHVLGILLSVLCIHAADFLW
ncbi:hypothetical protein GPALN_007822 [Globodera pallida]|nr:hypothetical protein GPALN_007822 [Globodera pallida]